MSRLDITFCDSDCKNKVFERNQSKIPRGFCVTCVNFSKDCENYKRMTNGDKIRSMNDEELAEFLDEIIECSCGVCPYEEGCDQEYDCGKKLTKWLKSEVK